MAFQIHNCAAQKLTLRQMREIMETGTLFYPASKHYTADLLTNLCVSCDNCDATALPACIGKESADLCLQCAAKLTEHVQMAPTTLFMGLHQTYAKEVAAQLGLCVFVQTLEESQDMTRVVAAVYCPRALTVTCNEDDVVVSVHKSP